MKTWRIPTSSKYVRIHERAWPAAQLVDARLIAAANAGWSRPPEEFDFRDPDTLLSSEPPRVRILRPADGAATDAAQIAVQAEVFSQNELPIREVRFLVNGRPSPQKVKGSDFLLPADLVLLSMGFVGPGTNTLIEDLDLKLDPRGMIQRDAEHKASRPGIFVAGDITHGASLVVRAINDGFETAKSVMNWLQAHTGDVPLPQGVRHEENTSSSSW